MKENTAVMSAVSHLYNSFQNFREATGIRKLGNSLPRPPQTFPDLIIEETVNFKCIGEL